MLTRTQALTTLESFQAKRKRIVDCLEPTWTALKPRLFIVYQYGIGYVVVGFVIIGKTGQSMGQSVYSIVRLADRLDWGRYPIVSNLLSAGVLIHALLTNLLVRAPSTLYSLQQLVGLAPPIDTQKKLESWRQLPKHAMAIHLGLTCVSGGSGILIGANSFQSGVVLYVQVGKLFHTDAQPNSSGAYFFAGTIALLNLVTNATFQQIAAFNNNLEFAWKIARSSRGDFIISLWDRYTLSSIATILLSTAIVPIQAYSQTKRNFALWGMSGGPLSAISTTSAIFAGISTISTNSRAFYDFLYGFFNPRQAHHMKQLRPTAIKFYWGVNIPLAIIDLLLTAIGNYMSARDFFGTPSIDFANQPPPSNMTGSPNSTVLLNTTIPSNTSLSTTPLSTTAFLNASFSYNANAFNNSTPITPEPSSVDTYTFFMIASLGALLFASVNAIFTFYGGGRRALNIVDGYLNNWPSYLLKFGYNSTNIETGTSHDPSLDPENPLIVHELSLFKPASESDSESDDEPRSLIVAAMTSHD